MSILSDFMYCGTQNRMQHAQSCIRFYIPRYVKLYATCAKSYQILRTMVRKIKCNMRKIISDFTYCGTLFIRTVPCSIKSDKILALQKRTRFCLFLKSYQILRTTVRCSSKHVPYHKATSEKKNNSNFLIFMSDNCFLHWCWQLRSLRYNFMNCSRLFCHCLLF